MKATANTTNEQALERYMMHMERIRETLASIAAKPQDNVAPEDVNWGHVGWIADLAAKLQEIEENF